MTPSAAMDVLPGFWRAAQIPESRIGYLAFQARRYGAIVDFLARRGRLDGRVVLDLGGGVGSLAVALHAVLGGTYEVADFQPPAPEHAAALAAAGVRRSFAVDLSRPGGLDALPSEYDLILFVEVLEHLLVNPLFLFRGIWEHLRPGGLLFLTTPNMARLRNRLALAAGRSIKEPGRYPVVPDPAYTNGHVVEFTLPELDQLLAFEGFARVDHRIVQQVPALRPTTAQRVGVRLLNLGLARRLALGDDILALYRKVERSDRSRLDPTARI